MEDMSIAEHFDLGGKVAIVTGGANGIGGAISSRLAEAGASVMISDIDEDLAIQRAAELQSRGNVCEGIRGDAGEA